MFGVYLVSFSDQILEATVTNEASIVDYWLTNNANNVVEAWSSSSTGHNKRHNIVGLNYSKSKNSKISTIQLCLGTKCLVLRIGNDTTTSSSSSSSSINIPSCLKRFLSNPNNVFVGIEVEKFVWVLKNEYGVCCNDTVFDVREIAKRRFPFSFGSGRVGLKTLAYQLLSFSSLKPKNKKACVESSLLKLLEKEQVKRVCVDVYVLFSLGFKLFMGI